MFYTQDKMLHFKKTYNDFQVREHIHVPECKHGEYMYVYVEKNVENTKDLIKRIAQEFSVQPYLVGFCGLKDKHAVCYQRISLGPKLITHLSHKQVLQKISTVCPVITYKYGTTSLSPKTSLSNEFFLYLTSDISYSQETLEKVFSFVQENGCPNFFGEQRFGWTKMNHAKGHALLVGTKKEKNEFERKFAIQAFASSVYNQILEKITLDKKLSRVLPGSIVVKKKQQKIFCQYTKKTYLVPVYDTRYFVAKKRIKRNDSFYRECSEAVFDKHSKISPAHCTKKSSLIMLEEALPTLAILGDNLPLPKLNSKAYLFETAELKKQFPLYDEQKYGIRGRRREQVLFPTILSRKQKKTFNKTTNKPEYGYFLHCILPKGSYMTTVIDYANQLLTRQNSDVDTKK